jgi:hypothetical protein
MAQKTQGGSKRMRGLSKIKGGGVWVQLQPEQLEALDAWIKKQPNPLSRALAIHHILDSRLKAKPSHCRSHSHSKSQLRDALEGLRAPTPISDRLKDDDHDYRERLIKWTIKDSKSRSAREVYNRLQVPEWILWLNEAAGESPKRIESAISAIQRRGKAQQKAADVRRVLRWERTAQLLFDIHSTSHRSVSSL